MSFKTDVVEGFACSADVSDGCDYGTYCPASNYDSATGTCSSCRVCKFPA